MEEIRKSLIGDKPLQAIYCTGIDNQKQGNKTPHTPNTGKTQRTAQLTKRSTLWFGMPFHDLQPGNGAGPSLYSPRADMGMQRIGISSR